MSLKNLSIALSTVFIVSCTLLHRQGEIASTARRPQQVTPVVLPTDTQSIGTEPVEIKIKTTFQTMMNANTDGERSQQVADFLSHQRDFFYIAEGYVNKFDAELDMLYHLKLAGAELRAEDKLQFFKASLQLRIAWEFSERNLHELLAIYELALIEANNPSSQYVRSCTWIVKNIAKWFEKGWKKGDQLAIISLARHFDEVNNDIRSNMQANQKNILLIPSYRKYSEPSKSTEESARRQSLIYVRDRKQTLFDTFIGKKWLEYSQSRKVSEESDLSLWQEDVGRKPQALDTLYPDPAAPGQVTGNRFPANTWAVTFDDGPHPTFTPGMFTVLKDYGLIGTFFWLSQNISKYPQLVTQAGQLGFNRGSHSFSHANLPKLDQAGLNHEINEALDIFNQFVGQPATFFRCPYGACGGSASVIRQMIAKRKALHILWNVDTLDWQDKNPQSVFERAKKQMEVLNHGIVLFHDIHPQSVEAFKLLASYIKQKGYQVKPLPVIIQEVTGNPYASP